MQHLTSKFILGIFFLSLVPGYAQVTLGGGRGQLRVQEAETVPTGQLFINGLYSVYLKKKSTISRDPQGAIIDKKENLVEDHTVNLNMTLGLSKMFELIVHTVPYQDDQESWWGPIGDSKIGIKLHIPHRGSSLQTGVLGFVKIPTAPRHNVAFEGFSTDAYGWGVVGLASLDLRSGKTALPFKFFINLGYMDHDWGDRYFSAKQDQVLAGFGFKFPVKATLLYLETTGEIFVNQADKLDLRQNFIRLSTGIRFVGPKQLIFDIAGDIRMGNYRPTPGQTLANPFLKEYADWKFLFGVTYRTQLFMHASESKNQLKRQNEETEKSDEIRKQREKVTRELEELRKKVEKSQTQPPE